MKIAPSMPRAGMIDLFVRRPTLAIVINLLILIAGAVALFGVDVREMPQVDQPVLSVRASYDGASAEIVDRQVTAVLEASLSRMEGLKNISSTSSYESSQISIDLNDGVDIDTATNDAREIVSQTMRELPEDMDEPSVSQNDSDAQPIVRLALSGTADIPELTSIAEGIVTDRLSVIEGVAEITVTGNQLQEFRVEIDMTALQSRGLSLDDVETALQALRDDTPLGSLDTGSETLTLRSASPDATVEDIATLRIDRTTRISDVAFVQLTSEDQSSSAYIDGQPSVSIDIVRESVGNTLTISQAVNQAVAELASVLPEGVSLAVTSDDGVFIEQSIKEVLSSIIMSTAIVILTIYAFIGSARATIIPAFTIPVALVGTIGAIWMAGFSINTITLLALVLATGMVVDDAIVVVENIVRKRREGMGRRAAAVAGTSEVFFAVLSTTATLAAVFIPISFLPGQAGGIFKEFGFVLAFSVTLSSIAALVLAPVLAAIVDPGRHDLASGQASRPSFLARGFDALVDRTIRSPILAICIAGAVAIIALGAAREMPSEVTPSEDRGFFMVMARSSSGDSVEVLETVISQIEGVLAPYREREVISTVQSLTGRGGSGMAFVIVRLADWADRDTPQQEVMADVSRQMGDIPGLTAFVRSSNSLNIRGGGGGGLEFAVSGQDRDALEDATDALISAMQSDSTFLNPQLSSEQVQPVLEVEVDREAARDLGLDSASISSSISMMTQGQTAITVFLEGEEVDVTLVPGDPAIEDPSDLEAIFTRTADGQYIPFSSVASLNQVVAPSSLDREAQSPAISAQANLGAGIDLGEAAERLEAIAGEVLPEGTHLVLLGEAAAIDESTQGFMLVFGVAFLIVLLVLAAQFESITSAVSIMVTVPFGIAAAVLAISFSGGSLNYYSQIGLVLLVGVMAKNGILIVEFANQLRAAGQDIDSAIRDAMRLRIRPVMMTMVSTVLGGLPLVLASGAGAEARVAVGWVIVGGLGFATVFTLVLTPAAYRLIAGFGMAPGAAASALDAEIAAARAGSEPL
ncbi:efflux RND transporter permease subunit [Paracoccus saliphilus]|uniref:Efflux RND transporter permease subunit n=1 Tax=Paracoccus saliphilus TaxID=405559 RepID=A0AA45W8S1_9RHOB|nr:efflux RND transporter permease subunit [Paracoccus saliphilus]WCR02653.1 efflux RND transporter permease subunit [Paracoccus saliphilus]SIT18473.1 hydrophobe/amphiphile efflux-1 (HAE1) family protein [Paracoccus saliphilus]